jgi:ATP-dependent DNA ligase
VSLITSARDTESRQRIPLSYGWASDALARAVADDLPSKEGTHLPKGFRLGMAKHDDVLGIAQSHLCDSTLARRADYVASHALFRSRLPIIIVEPCVPSFAKAPPTGPDWVHEIKHDGFRVIARRDGKKIRLISRKGKDLTYRFPLAAQAIRRAHRFLERRAAPTTFAEVERILAERPRFLVVDLQSSAHCLSQQPASGVPRPSPEA